MTPIWTRILIGLAILVVDALFFILPLGALFIAYVIIARPRWVKEWLDQLYG